MLKSIAMLLLASPIVIAAASDVSMDTLVKTVGAPAAIVSVCLIAMIRGDVITKRELLREQALRAETLIDRDRWMNIALRGMELGEKNAETVHQVISRVEKAVPGSNSNNAVT